MKIMDKIKNMLMMLFAALCVPFIMILDKAGLQPSDY
jgi:hypothetical protein